MVAGYVEGPRDPNKLDGDAEKADEGVNFERQGVDDRGVASLSDYWEDGLCIHENLDAFVGPAMADVQQEEKNGEEFARARGSGAVSTHDVLDCDEVLEVG